MLSGLSTTGTYILEIYYELSGDSFGGCGTIKSQNNNGHPDNYTLRFDYTAPNYTLTYNGNTSDGGSTTPTTGTLPLTVASNSFTKTGYTFSSWNTSSDGTGTSYAEGASYNVASDATLYAQWTSSVITASGSLTAFSTCEGSFSSEQSFDVSGSGLSEDITVTAPSGFEISTTSGSGFASSIVLSESGGTVGATTVYTRLASASVASGASDTPSGNVTCASTGATTKYSC